MQIVDMTDVFDDDSPYPTRTASLDDFIVHHAESTIPTSLDVAMQSLRNIHAFHQGPDRKWPGIAYHRAVWNEHYFLLRSRSKNGWHTGGMDISPKNGIGDANDHGMACVLLGTYTHVAPSARTLQTVAEGKQWEESQIGYELRLNGHQDYVATACPGEGWKFWRSGIVLPNTQPPAQPQTLEDVIFGLRIALAHTADIVVADELNAMLDSGYCDFDLVRRVVQNTQEIREQFIGLRP